MKKMMFPILILLVCTLVVVSASRTYVGASVVVSSTATVPYTVTETIVPTDAEAARSNDRPTQYIVTDSYAVVTTGIDSGYLNLRECPSTECRVLEVLPEGTTIQLLQSQDAWYQVIGIHLTGWVYSDFVKEGD